MAAPIPDRVSYEQACVLALALSTASCALYQKDQLALELPAVPARSSTDKTVLLWGGATNVGCCAVQLAVASGYEVVTVASPKNFGLLETLGAASVFDYHAADVFEELVGALAGKDCAGGLVTAPGSLRDNEVGRAVYSDFLGKALAAGSFACVPEPYVVGEGLESLQKAFEVCREGGLSAKKIVVTLA